MTSVMSSPRKEGSGQTQNMADSLVDMEERMREEIRQLQEQRAAAMMNEIIDLQRERDLAMGRVKTLKKTIEDLTMENVVLKNTVGSGDLTERLLFLERSILEERLMTSDLRKKLRKVKEQNETLVSKLHRLAEHNVDEKLLTVSGSPNTMRLDRNVVMLQREKSYSMNDLKSTENQERPKEQERGAVTPKYQRSDSLKAPSKQNAPSPLLKVTNASPSTIPKGVTSSTSPQTYSPTVIPRRYKLAAAVCRDASTQTDIVDSTSASQDSSTSHSSDLSSLLASAKTNINRLQDEKKELEGRLCEETAKREKDTERHINLSKTCEMLQAECSVLRDSLVEFSRWVRQKIQLAEEDMDIFKVVYSLHGSLSQEAATLSELQSKLGSAEQKVLRLEATNKHLTEVASQAEERHKQSEKEINMLRAKLSLFTQAPQYSPTLRHSSPSHTRKASPNSSKRRVGANKSYKHSSPRPKHSSPLLALKASTSGANDIV